MNTIVFFRKKIIGCKLPTMKRGNQFERLLKKYKYSTEILRRLKERLSDKTSKLGDGRVKLSKGKFISDNMSRVLYLVFKEHFETTRFKKKIKSLNNSYSKSYKRVRETKYLSKVKLPDCEELSRCVELSLRISTAMDLYILVERSKQIPDSLKAYIKSGIISYIVPDTRELTQKSHIFDERRGLTYNSGGEEENLCKILLKSFRHLIFEIHRKNKFEIHRKNKSGFYLKQLPLAVNDFNTKILRDLFPESTDTWFEKCEEYGFILREVQVINAGLSREVYSFFSGKKGSEVS